jgi:uncharacterized RDD family membrane protein YckC
MKIPKKLLFNFFTKEALERSSNIFFLNRRLKSMSTDFSYLLSISFPFFLIVIITIFIVAAINENVSILFPISFGLIPFSLFTVVLLNKDYFNGKSIAKRKFGYQIIDIKTGRPANEIQCVLRNSTLIIWPIEVLVSLFSPYKRLGDLIAATKLIDTEKENPEFIMDEINKKKKIENRPKLIWISVFIALTFSILSVLPIILTLI